MNAKRPAVDWWLVAIALAGAIVSWLMLGCATCDPIIVKEPVEVKIPVPVPPVPLFVEPAPIYEVCGQETAAARLVCVGRNIVKLREYARALLDEIEAHNAAVVNPPQ
jgi:hypothetical protein